MSPNRSNTASMAAGTPARSVVSKATVSTTSAPAAVAAAAAASRRSLGRPASTTVRHRPGTRPATMAWAISEAPPSTSTDWGRPVASIMVVRPPWWLVRVRRGGVARPVSGEAGPASAHSPSRRPRSERSTPSGSTLRLTVEEVVDAGVHGPEGVGGQPRVLGQVDPPAGLQHLLVEVVEQLVEFVAARPAGRGPGSTRASGTRAGPGRPGRSA